MLKEQVSTSIVDICFYILYNILFPIAIVYVISRLVYHILL